MKQIFTLLTIAFVSVFSTKANSQNVYQGFETSAEVTTLVNSCWIFNSVNFTTNAPINGTGSMISQLGVTSEIITPELVMPSTSITVSFGYSVVADNNGSQKIQVFISDGVSETRLYDGSPANSGTGTITATLSATGPQGANLTGSKRVIIRISNNLSLKVDNLTINAPYTYSTGCPFESIPLPVQLISFNGSLVNNKVQLKWFIAENETGDRFEIEKSNDGTNFKSVGMVLLTGKVGTENYAFNEGIELTGAGYYRLKIVNKSGAIVYSNIVVLKNEKATTANSLVVLQNKGAEVTFNYTPAKEGIYNVNVYNVNGAKMFGTRISMQKGMNAASLKANGLISSGVYVLEVTNGSDRSIIKFIK